MSHHAIYINNPTASAKDGTVISSNNPLKVTLNSTQSESAVVKCAVRCDEGYKIDSDCTVSFIGSTADKWQLSSDGTTWQDEISLANITDVNKIFYVKASSAGESPQDDTSVTIQAVGVVSTG